MALLASMGLVHSAQADTFPAVLQLSSLDGTTGFRLDDLLIGARGADPNGPWSGSSYIVFGRDVAPTLGFAPSNLSFGNVPLGNSSTPQSVTISNTGDADLLISSISTPAVPFALSGGTCPATPFSLLPDTSCDLTIEFSPTTPGDFSASIVIQSNAPGGSDEILLDGTTQALIAEAMAIPTLDRIGLILLSGLLGWLGIRRRFAHTSRE